MPDPTTTTEPSSPNPQYAVVWGGYIRTLVAALGGAGIGVGVFSHMTAEQWSALITAGLPIIGALITFATGLWSRWQKYRAAQLDHAGNVASARASKATKVISTEGVVP